MPDPRSRNGRRFPDRGLDRGVSDKRRPGLERGRRSRVSSGRFSRGDTISVLDKDGNEIARGMVAYNDRDATRLVGKRSADIEALLGFRGRAEIIHRDDMVIMKPEFVPA